jgi:hypothetical protein|tara:strand:+ start:13251 stop:13427 length:177 start_codon:yes stop_codon:yes gene_type:complete
MWLSSRRLSGAPTWCKSGEAFSYHEDFFAKSQMGGCTFASLGLNTAAPQETTPEHFGK